MKRYPDMRETELSWTNSLPAHWDERRGKFLFYLKKRPIREEDEVITAFRDGQVTLRTNRRTEGFTNSLKEIGYQGVRKGDLVIHAMDGFAGAIGVSDSDGKCSPVYSCCVGRNGINADFYAYLLRNMAKTGFIESLAKGIRERSTDFRWNDFAELGLPLPPAQEQTRISTTLDRETARIDALVEKKARFIELLREKRQALITQAVTKGLDRNERSGCRLRFIVRLAPSSREARHLDSDSDVTFAPMETIADGNGGLESSNIRKFKDVASASYNYFADGDILLAKVTPCFENGKKAIAENLINGVGFATSEVFVVRPEETKIDSLYLYYILASEDFRAEAISSMTGTGGLKRISDQSILDYRPAITDVEEQSNVAKRLSSECSKMDSLLRLTQQSIDLLKERRSALITAAVTVQIDFREAI